MSVLNRSVKNWVDKINKITTKAQISIGDESPSRCPYCYGQAVLRGVSQLYSCRACDRTYYVSDDKKVRLDFPWPPKGKLMVVYPKDINS